MATDNTTLPTGTGGDIISTDVITTLNGATIATGEKAQRVKVGWGVDATFTDTTAANPLPVTNSSLPLPTGAATSAKQPALGTAGSASADVLTVQGIASMTALKTDGSGVTQPVSGSVTADTELPAAALLADATALPTTPIVGGANMTRNGAGTLDMQRSVTNNTNTSGAGIAAAGMIGQFDDVSPNAITENQFGNVRMSANRNLYSTIRDAAGNERGVNVTAGNALTVDGSATTQPVSGTVTANAGTGNFAANLTQINGSAISASNPLPTTQVAPTGNGFTPYKLINAATTNATNVKASAGDVGGIQVYNNSGVVAYFKLYDKASAPTVGTDTPVKTIIVPANTSGAGTNVSFASPGISFTNGISFALTTGITDADTGAIASANTISVNIDYK